MDQDAQEKKHDRDIEALMEKLLTESVEDRLKFTAHVVSSSKNFDDIFAELSEQRTQQANNQRKTASALKDILQVHQQSLEDQRERDALQDQRLQDQRKSDAFQNQKIDELAENYRGLKQMIASLMIIHDNNKQSLHGSAHMRQVYVGSLEEIQLASRDEHEQSPVKPVGQNQGRSPLDNDAGAPEGGSLHGTGASSGSDNPGFMRQMWEAAFGEGLSSHVLEQQQRQSLRNVAAQDSRSETTAEQSAKYRLMRDARNRTGSY